MSKTTRASIIAVCAAVVSLGALGWMIVHSRHKSQTGEQSNLPASSPDTTPSSGTASGSSTWTHDDRERLRELTALDTTAPMDDAIVQGIQRDALTASTPQRRTAALATILDAFTSVKEGHSSLTDSQRTMLADALRQAISHESDVLSLKMAMSGVAEAGLLNEPEMLARLQSLSNSSNERLSTHAKKLLAVKAATMKK